MISVQQLAGRLQIPEIDLPDPATLHLTGKDTKLYENHTNELKKNEEEILELEKLIADHKENLDKLYRKAVYKEYRQLRESNQQQELQQVKYTIVKKDEQTLLKLIDEDTVRLTKARNRIADINRKHENIIKQTKLTRYLEGIDNQRREQKKKEREEKQEKEKQRKIRQQENQNSARQNLQVSDSDSASSFEVIDQEIDNVNVDFDEIRDDLDDTSDTIIEVDPNRSRDSILEGAVGGLGDTPIVSGRSSDKSTFGRTHKPGRSAGKREALLRDINHQKLVYDVTINNKLIDAAITQDKEAENRRKSVAKQTLEKAGKRVETFIADRDRKKKVETVTAETETLGNLDVENIETEFNEVNELFGEEPIPRENRNVGVNLPAFVPAVVPPLPNADNLNGDNLLNLNFDVDDVIAPNPLNELLELIDREEMAEENHGRHYKLDIPKFKGSQDEKPNFHLLEFKDFMQTAFGINLRTPRVQPFVAADEANEIAGQPRINDYEKIIPQFASSLKSDARFWYDLNFGHLTEDEYDAAHWTVIQDKFKQYFSHIGKTPTEKYLAWENFSWNPASEDVQKMMLRFYEHGDAAGADDNSKKSKLVKILKPISTYAADQVCQADNIDEGFTVLTRMMATGGANIVRPSDPTNTNSTVGVTPQFMVQMDNGISQKSSGPNKQDTAILGKMLANQKEITDNQKDIADGLLMVTQEIKNMNFNSQNRNRDSTSPYRRNQRVRFDERSLSRNRNDSRDRSSSRNRFSNYNNSSNGRSNERNNFNTGYNNFNRSRPRGRGNFSNNNNRGNFNARNFNSGNRPNYRNFNNNPNRGNFNNNNRSNVNFRNSTRRACTYCNKPGHVIEECYTLQNAMQNRSFNRSYNNNNNGNNTRKIIIEQRPNRNQDRINVVQDAGEAAQLLQSHFDFEHSTNI